MTIKEHITGQAHFRYYRDEKLWYQTDSGFLFPVPIDDIGGATYNADEKGIILMRWIRKWMAVVEAEQHHTD